MDAVAKSLHCFLEREVEASTILIIEEKGLPAIAILSDGFLVEDLLDASEAGHMGRTGFKNLLLCKTGVL